MIFPQYNYRNFDNSNKQEWALQPPTIENWCKMINESVDYCIKILDMNEFKGKCKESELPSFHPYWKHKTKENTINMIKQTKGLISQTEKYIYSNGYYKMNAIKSIKIQKEFINYLESKLQLH
jgi:hypothetical protein